MRNDLSYHEVSEILKPDFETGKLYWLDRPLDSFASKATGEIWNATYAGKEAFTNKHFQGYLISKIKGKVYRAHRIIWLLAYEKWPENQIDHINGVRDDNRLVNLRDVSNAENGRNKRKPSHNTTGVVGVYKDKGKKWRVRIRVNNISQYVGLFERFEDAISARKMAEKKYGFHENHGRDM